MGKPIGRPPTQVTAKELILDILRVTRELAIPYPLVCSSREYKRHGKWSLYLVEDRLGSWSHVVQKLLGRQSKRARVTREELVEDIKRVARKLKCEPLGPTMDEYDGEGRFSRHSVRRRWGRYNLAVLAAGLQPRQAR